MKSKKEPVRIIMLLVFNFRLIKSWLVIMEYKQVSLNKTCHLNMYCGSGHLRFLLRCFRAVSEYCS